MAQFSHKNSILTQNNNEKPPTKKVKKAWNAVEKQLRIDINKYIAKYDFDVAKKICPMVSGTNYREELQNTFKMTAMLEVIQLCSQYINKGKKTFQSLYTLDGKFVRDLEDIPEDCQIILVSENPPPKEQLNRLSVQDQDCLSDLENSKIMSNSSSAERLPDPS